MSGHRPLEAFLNQQLPPPEHQAFVEHLAHCPECRAQVEQWEAVRGRIVEWADSVVAQPTPQQAHELVQRARGGAPRRSNRGRYAWVVLSGVTCALVAVVLLLPLPRDPEDAPAPPPVAVLPPAWVAPLVMREAHGGQVLEGAQGERQVTSGNAQPLVADLGADRLVLAPRSALAVQPAPQGAQQLVLTAGAVSMHAAPRNVQTSLTVTAGPFSVRVVGTVFQVEVIPPQDVRVAVAEGVVEVSAPNRQKVRVSGGQVFDSRAPEAERLAVLPASEVQSLSDTVGVSAGTPVPPAPTPAVPLEKVRPVGPAVVPRAAAPATRADPSTWEEWLINGKSAEAERALLGHLKREPRDARAWELLAEARRRQGDWSGAVTAYRRTIQTADEGAANRARFKGAVVLDEKLSRPADAAELLRAYLKRPPAHSVLAPEATLRLAKCELALGHPREARQLLMELSRTNPDTDAAAHAADLLKSLPPAETR